MGKSSWRDRIGEKSATWLVTGAAGFIGSHLILELLRLGQHVVGLDNFATGYRHNLEQVRASLKAAEWSNLRFIEGDIRDLDVCRTALEGVDYVLHQAALGSVPRSIKHPHETFAVNASGSVSIFNAALQERVRKVVYASSSSVYGSSEYLPKVEDRLGEPLSPYAASKRSAELYATALWRSRELPVVGLRYFNVIGPRQDPTGPYAAVVPRWIQALLNGERPTIYGDGATSRDFCPVENVVQANILAAMSGPATEGNVYNVSLGGSTTLIELAEILIEVLAGVGIACDEIEPRFEPFRPGDIRHSSADISRARSDLGYLPEVSVREALHRTAESEMALQASTSVSTEPGA